MKKNYLIILFLVLIARQAFAAPAYGTKMPEKGNFFIGGQTHIVQQRELEKDNGKMSSSQNFFLISYGVLDWLSLDLKGGAGNVQLHKTDSEDFNYHSFLAGGYGFRIKYLDQEKLKAVFGFQHISDHPYTIDRDGKKYKAVLDDWQLSTLISYDLHCINPYAGVKLSTMNYINWIDTERNLVKSDSGKSVGLVAGMDIPFNKKIWLNVEGQFVDVKAIAASINFSF
ncbi:MAG: outer membrane beta-barrel protein [Candidatus Omnitrophica bacterium]|nr:outer membrane beta-barrel protein [Candidatus Omnitrophota bacterium]